MDRPTDLAGDEEYSTKSEKSFVTSSLVFYRAPGLKVVYIPCFKNASTSVLLWLAELEALSNGRQFSASSGFRRHAKDYLHVDSVALSGIVGYLTEHSDHFIFGISRNPFSRLVSAYKDKVNRLAKKAMPTLYYKAKLCQIASGPGSWLSNKSAVSYIRNRLSFSVFLETLASVGVDIDVHYQLQYSLMRPDLLRTARFYRQENFAGLVTRDIKRHASERALDKKCADNIIWSLPQKNSSVISSEDDYRLLFNLRLQDIAADLYKPDFEAFAYDPRVL